MPPGRRIPRPPAERPKRSASDDTARPPAELAKAGAELASLVATIRACRACGRASDLRALGSGNPRAPIMFLKEHPSGEDLKVEAAFATEAEALGRALDHLQIPLSWVYGSTAVRCASGSATGDEARACAGHLLVELEAVQPSVLVVFGERALDAVRALDGRCGLAVPDEIERGKPVGLRPGLVALLTGGLPEGVTEPQAKRALWRDLQQLPGFFGREGGVRPPESK